MIKLFSLLFSVIMSITIYSQSLSEIKNSGIYLFGTGISEDLKEAGKDALDDLSSQISVQVESDFISIVKEIGGDFEEYTKSVVKTYTNTSLQEVSKKEFKEGQDWVVIRYIQKDKLDEIFLSRKEKIIDYVKIGEKAESENRIADALKNYYWAWVLLHSHPDNNRIRFSWESNNEIGLLIGLNDRINRLFSLIDIEIDKIVKNENAVEKTIILKITFNGHLVENFDYKYQHGNEESMLMSARNGLGSVDLYGESSKHLEKIWIKTEYEYKNKIYDPEVTNVMGNIFLPHFKQSDFFIEISPNKKLDELSLANKAKFKNVESLNNTKIFAKPKYYRQVIEEVLKAIDQKDPYIVNKYFTESGFDVFTDLIKEGQVLIVGLPDTLKLVKINDEVMVRQVPMSFHYQNNQRIFIENVVFIFDNNNKITSLTFSLGEKAISDIISKSNEHSSIEEKYQIISFMESYKTAYCLKRIDYIESIFAENALIIVGHDLKKDSKKNIENMYYTLGGEKVKYIRHTKKSYIDALRNVFKRNEFVNIQFEDNKVLKRNIKGDKIFGIQIAQNWWSSTYSDFGYLFLAIDLEDISKPKIYVRTWQPEKSADGSIYGLTDFKFD